MPTNRGYGRVGVNALPRFRGGRAGILKIAVLACAVCAPLPAETVAIGRIGVWAGLGSQSSYQQVLVYNDTANDCTMATIFPLVCGSINFTDWQVAIYYSILSGGAQVPQLTPLTNSGLLIDPTFDPVATPLYALPYSETNPCCDTIVMQIVFTATLPQHLTIWTPGASSASDFYPLTPFTFTMTTDAFYQNGDLPFSMVDLTVDNDPNGGGTGPGIPEPATVALFAGGAAAMALRRFFAR